MNTVEIPGIALLIAAAAVVLVLLTAIIIGVRLYVKKRTRKAALINTSLSKSLIDERTRSTIIINSIEDGVVLFDDNKTIQLFNPGAAVISGWASEDVSGLNFHNVMIFTNQKGEPYPDGNHPFERIFLDKKTVRDNTAYLTTKGKKLVPITCSVSPLLSEDGVVTGGVAVFRDVTSERAEEQQRAEFISTASHEMRTPVAAIEGYLALALNAKVATIDERAKNYLEKAHLSTQHLGKLFQDLLTSAKAEDGRLTNHPTVVEIGEFAQQLAEDLKFSADRKGLFSEFVLGSSKNIDTTQEKMLKPLYYVYADPDRLREVITNIFDNACKYTEKGKVSLGLTGNNDVVQLYVRDTGPGIPADDVAHLFEKFYRVDNSATRTIGGTGLGLFICRKIVELYQGRIWADSVIGQGSTFFINLPRLSSAKAEEMLRSGAGGDTVPPLTTSAGS
ncbi:MAG: hypothetical protein JWM37_652 [Candidatus Saccharibacteria bacterium]|nr:hypothetical protein [Candidatus Saccharibacteria bacterium]